ncbi:AraC family transcriptional regulator [Opitutaceae bacterium TAV3]|nr:AraC family transcriptional regulator [Opitutaceae bacterium TAV3]
MGREAGRGGGGGGCSTWRAGGELVNQGCSHVRNNLAERLALGDVASHFKITPEHLTRSFQRQLGVSFHRYVLAERIAQAKERLRNQPGATVTDIAFECGFVSSDHFGKVFKRHTLMTPSEFRETQA